MNTAIEHTSLSPENLLKIIKLQTDIVKLGPDLSSVMNLVTEQVQYLTHAAGAIVELTEGEEMVYRATTGIAKQQLGLRLKRKGSLSGLCVEGGEILQCDDSECDPRVDKEACRKVGLRSMVVAPLFHQETVVGVLKIASPFASSFTDEHVCILNLTSDLIASSMFYSAKFEIKELYHRATHDTLTGLANRSLFYDHLRQVLALASRQSVAVGILNLDMDGLKFINDNYGHRAGDAAIKEIGQRIDRASRESDIVARLGGDEFGVILPELLDRSSAELVANRMGKEICLPFYFEDKPLKLDASIGMAIFPEDANELDTLIEKADQSMYQVKRSRKS
jgi:diguanylate cyclase (GGDEF)-like protein